MRLPALFLLALACTPPPPPTGGDDAGSTSSVDLDAGSSPVPDGGHGRITGSCGRVAGELASSGPAYFEVHLDFASDGFDDPQERPRLTAGAQQILSEGTAGGSSGVSEAFAFEVLALCESAAFVKSETTIVYEPPTSKKTDILVRIADQRVGVSVTRAVAYPVGSGYSVTPERVGFLEGKLDDILISSQNVVADDRWVKQLLVIMAYDEIHAATLRSIWQSLDEATRADTVVYVVITDGDDRSVYFTP